MQVARSRCTLIDSTAACFRTQVLNMLAGCSRDAMSARQEHTTLVAKQQSGGDSKAGAKGGDAEHEGERDEASPHPGDEGSLRRWEELLRSSHVNGGRWRPGVIEGGVTNGECCGLSLGSAAVCRPCNGGKDQAPLVPVLWFL